MNLKELCRRKGTNVSKLAEQAGIAPSTLYAISSGETSLDKVGVSVFIKISNALGYTTDELFSLLSGEPETPQLSSDEQELVEILRNITAEGKKELMIHARGILATYPKNTEIHGHKTA